MKRWIAVGGVVAVLAFLALRGVAQYHSPPSVNQSTRPPVAEPGGPYPPPPAQGYYQPQPGQYQSSPVPPVAAPVQPPPAPAYAPPAPVQRVPPPSASRPFLEVGKSYTFGMSSGKSDGLEKCKVVELPGNGWVKVKVKDGDKLVTVWINLNHVAYVFQGGSPRGTRSQGAPIGMPTLVGPAS